VFSFKTPLTPLFKAVKSLRQEYLARPFFKFASAIILIAFSQEYYKELPIQRTPHSPHQKKSIYFNR